MTGDERIELAQRFFAAIERGDVDAVREMYAPDAVIWHNFDQIEQRPDDNLRVLAWLTRTVTALRYDEVRRVDVGDGVVQQHVLRGTTPGGAPLAVPAMMRIDMADGRITRIEEYLDTAQVGALQP